MARAAVAIELTNEEERELRALLRRPSVSQQQALRARIVLRAALGENERFALAGGALVTAAADEDADVLTARPLAGDGAPRRLRVPQRLSGQPSAPRLTVRDGWVPLEQRARPADGGQSLALWDPATATSALAPLPVERANALLKRTWKALERVTLDPWRIGAITAAALVLLHLQRPTR